MVRPLKGFSASSSSSASDMVATLAGSSSNTMSVGVERPDPSASLVFTPASSKNLRQMTRRECRSCSGYLIAEEIINVRSSIKNTDVPIEKRDKNAASKTLTRFVVKNSTPRWYSRTRNTTDTKELRSICGRWE
jgi:gas vesicle protein